MRTNKLRIRGIAASTLLLGFLFINPCRTFSQETKGKSVEEIKTTLWTTQAASVAMELGLKKKKLKMLTEAYLGLREDISVQSKEKLKELEGEARKQESDLITASCAKTFEGKLATFLEPEQVSRAAFILGSLNNRWEQYLGHLFEFGLNEEKMDKASQAVYEYIGDYLTERKKASDADTRFSGEIATQLKEELDAKIVTLLSEEQYAEWSRSTARKPRGN